MSKKILIVAAHPDDEVLGMGGTIAKYADEGHNVKVLFMTDGVSSREETSKESIGSRKSASLKCSEILGFKIVDFLNFPDNGLDKLPRLEIEAVKLALERQKPS